MSDEVKEDVEGIINLKKPSLTTQSKARTTTQRKETKRQTKTKPRTIKRQQG